MRNFVEGLYEFGGNATHEEFWNMFFGYGFKVMPTLELFQIAFGDDEGTSYFKQMKSLVNDFWNSVNACARFENCKEKIVWEINNPEEYKKELANQKPDSTLKIMNLFFDKKSIDYYKGLVKQSDDEREEIKKMIAKFGVDNTKKKLYEVFDEYLKELLEELGIRRVDEIASTVDPTSCYYNMEDPDDEIEKDSELRKLACFVKENILPEMTSED